MLNYPSVNLGSYYGAPKTKHLLRYCKSNLAIENTMSPVGYTTEKPLESLVFGCVPIYISNNESNWLSPFIEILPTDSLSILRKSQMLSSQPLAHTRCLAEGIRQSINEYLNFTQSTTLWILYDLIMSGDCI
jgi:hypothetical protein